MLEIALMRHGQTLGNVQGQYVGRTDESLSDAGRLALTPHGAWSAECVYSSPLKRCLETCQRLYPQVPLSVVTDLQECDFGEFEGKNYAALKDHPVYQQWLAAGGQVAFPGGEDPADFRRRCQRAFAAIVDEALRQGSTHLAIVTHGGVIMAILAQFARPSADFYHWQVANGAGYLLGVHERVWAEQHVLSVIESWKGGGDK